MKGGILFTILPQNIFSFYSHFMLLWENSIKWLQKFHRYKPQKRCLKLVKICIVNLFKVYFTFAMMKFQFLILHCKFVCRDVKYRRRKIFLGDFVLILHYQRFRAKLSLNAASIKISHFKVAFCNLYFLIEL